MTVEQDEVDYLPWYPGQPNGGRHQHCVEAKTDPSQDLGQDHKIIMTCSEYLKQTL